MSYKIEHIINLLIPEKEIQISSKLVINRNQVVSSTFFSSIYNTNDPSILAKCCINPNYLNTNIHHQQLFTNYKAEILKSYKSLKNEKKVITQFVDNPNTTSNYPISYEGVLFFILLKKYTFKFSLSLIYFDKVFFIVNLNIFVSLYNFSHILGLIK